MVGPLAGLCGGLFYLRSLAKRIFFELPLHSDESAKARLNEAALQSGTGPNEIAVLYFPSLNERKLVAESRPVKWAPTSDDRVRQVLLGLAADHTRVLVTPDCLNHTSAPFSLPWTELLMWTSRMTSSAL